MAVHRAGAWADRGWPVLAGTVTAIGVVGAATAYTVAGAVLVFSGMGAFGALVLYCLASEYDVGPARAVRLGAAGGVGVVVLMGLLALLPLAGWVLAAVCVVTAPTVTGWAGRRVAGVRGGRTTTDRAFEQIVAALERDF
jgi:hypothetical protein